MELELEQIKMKKFSILMSVLFLSGCLLSDNWTQRLPGDIDYQARHDKTIEDRKI